MKKIVLLTMLMVAAFGIKAQDTIVLRNGNEVKAKVEKISSNEIEYRSWEFQDGPLRTKSVDEVFMIKYSNGQHEVFEQLVPKRDKGDLSLFGLERDGSSIVYRSNGEEPENIEMLLGEVNYNEYISARENITAGGVLIAAGLLAGGAAIAIWASDFESESHLMLAIMTDVVADVFFITGIVVRAKNKGKISRIAENYNYSNGYSMDFGISPTLLPVASGNVAPGVGITLRF
jgi:hypothetical protein